MEVPYILPERVAELLQIPLSSVYAKANNGTIPAVKIGRLWRFNEEKIMKYIEKHYSNDYCD
jgi:excisionase family DNA binding protein